MSRTDWELVDQVQRGDQRAFSQLYTRRAPGIHHFIARHIHDRMLTEDLVQETFLRAWRGLSSVRQQKWPFTAWLLAIAKNLMLDYFRTTQRRQYYEWRFICLIAHHSGAHTMSIPEWCAIQTDIHEKVADALARLAPRQQECIRLRFIHERSLSETSSAMSLSKTEIYNLTRRAITALRAQPEIQGLRSPSTFRS